MADRAESLSAIGSLSAEERAAFALYPSAAQVDAWAKALCARAQRTPCAGAFTGDMPVRTQFGNSPNTLVNRYVRFDAPGRRTFYGYWQPAPKQPAPLLVHLPGYGGCITMHPQICDDGYNILHVSPLGYVTPQGERDERGPDGQWPVLHNTAMGLAGGYDDWLLDALGAVRWAAALPESLPGRLSVYGTSQGGGGALLLASLLGPQVRCVCADVPFLTAFPLSHLAGDAYGLLQRAHAAQAPEAFWGRLGFVDTLSHAHRLHLPVLLSAGGRDDVCPAATVELLFERLRCTKQYSYLADNVHTHSRESMFLLRSWFALFA